MFFGYKNKDGSFSVSHVGMVYDNKDGVVEMIHASSSNGVRIDKTDSNTWNSYWSRKFLFVKRILD
jgi:cell wall-associated NlpC family hydrolase